MKFFGKKIRSTSPRQTSKPPNQSTWTNTPKSPPTSWCWDVVLAKKKERPLFVQPHLVLVPAEGVEGEQEVQLRTFVPTVEGVIQSFQARFPAFDEEMLELWRKDREALVPLYLAEGVDGSDSKRHKAENGNGGAVLATA